MKNRCVKSWVKNLSSAFFKLIENKIKKFAPLAKEERPPKGWIAIKLPSVFLAKTLSFSQSRISQIEKQEIEGTLTLNTISAVADALNCEFVYALVPKDGSLEKMLEKFATFKAKAILNDTLKTMALENQTPSNLNEQYEAIKQELLLNKNGALWK